MRTLSLFFFLCFVALGQDLPGWAKLHPATSGPVTEGRQLSIAVEKQTFYNDEPVRIVVYDRNVSGEPITAGIDQSDWRAVTVEIRRAGDGKLVDVRAPKDEFERLRRLSGSIAFVTAKPGEEAMRRVFDLHSMFDLEPGAYRVRVCRNVAKRSDRAAVRAVSNEVAFSILAH